LSAERSIPLFNHKVGGVFCEELTAVGGSTVSWQTKRS
jgi:hypothetical protein